MRPTHRRGRHFRQAQVARLFKEWCPAMPGFHLYYPSRKQMRAALRGFVDWCIKRRQDEQAATDNFLFF